MDSVDKREEKKCLLGLGPVPFPPLPNSNVASPASSRRQLLMGSLPIGFQSSTHFTDEQGCGLSVSDPPEFLNGDLIPSVTVCRGGAFSGSNYTRRAKSS